jgi:subtilisin family serine protease
MEIQSEQNETTGRYILTFREGAHDEALSTLADKAGLRKANLMRSADFRASSVDMSQLPRDGGVLLEQLGIAVVDADPDAAGALAHALGDNSAILALEPEGIMYALTDVNGLSLDYLKGFRDAAENLFTFAAPSGSQGFENDIASVYNDTATFTWGLQATKVDTTRYSGQGIKLAFLDTGLCVNHPDFAGRPIIAQSFVPGSGANNGFGHGTHCIGTACGPLKPGVGRRYGIAHQALIHVGKVLSDQGSGADGAILAGIDWAVTRRCEVIALALGGGTSSASTAYEVAGQRALNAGCLIVSAAGGGASRSSGQYGSVGRPANCRSILAVGAVDQQLGIANFSPRDTARVPGSAIDIVGPGVDVYSSACMPTRTRIVSGTSTAVAHVAGIAALWVQATGNRGAGLWHQLTVNARSLPLLYADVGTGLIQAP